MSDATLESTLEELAMQGVVILDEQIDLLRQPDGRLAVALLGVADPDCLYIQGPNHTPTIMQLANPGEECDHRGKRHCILPIVLQLGDTESFRHVIDDYYGASDSPYPIVIGEPCDAEWTWNWLGDECPLEVVVWDLWPITADDVDAWATASTIAWNESKMDAAWHLTEIFQGSESYETDEISELQEQLYDRSLTQEEDRAVRARISTLIDAEMGRLEAEILHPVSGEWDPQFPPLQLPPELDALWSSLLSLSKQNWDLLSKQAAAAGGVLHGRRFEDANRRLCPWY